MTWGPEYTFHWRKVWRYRELTFEIRPPKGTGRFGGGWNWKIGIQWGGSTILLSLIIAQLRYDRIPRGCCRCRWAESTSSGSIICRCPFKGEIGVEHERFDNCEHAQNDESMYPKPKMAV